MSTIMMHATLDSWISNEAISFSMDSTEAFSASIDRVVASLEQSVQLLGFGEALHGGEGILIQRNRLFEHLVESHGCSAIAIESSFPRAFAVDDYVNARGLQSYEEILGAGFSHGFGKLQANRELVEWMRSYLTSRIY